MEFVFQDDSATWQLFKNGDQQAFAYIYTRYSPNLYEYGMRMLQDEDVTRDVMHDLFVKLWQNRQSAGSTNNIKYYLITSLRNLIFTRKSIDNRMLHEELHESTGFNMEFTPESEYIRKEQLGQLSELLLEALNKLSPRQKEIIYLRYFEELDYNEVAELMNMSVKAAYKLSARALDTLREIMKIPITLIFFLLMINSNLR